MERCCLVHLLLHHHGSPTAPAAFNQLDPGGRFAAQLRVRMQHRELPPCLEAAKGDELLPWHELLQGIDLRYSEATSRRSAHREESV